MANHDAMFIDPEPGVHDGCFLIVAAKSEAEIAALNARLASLPEQSAKFVEMTKRLEMRAEYDAKMEKAALKPLDGKKVLAYGKKTAKKGGDANGN